MLGPGYSEHIPLVGPQPKSSFDFGMEAGSARTEIDPTIDKVNNGTAICITMDTQYMILRIS